MATEDRPVIDCVLESAALGLRCFPLWPGKKTPKVAGWKAWATTDEEMLRKHWREHPGDNYGIAFDGKRFVGIDIDLYQPTVQPWLDANEVWPPTRTVTTPAEGLHYIYSLPDDVTGERNIDLFKGGVEVKLRGTYLVGPGSRLSDYKKTLKGPGGETEERTFNGRYRLDPAVPVAIARAPDFLLRHINEQCQQRPAAPTTTSGTARIQEGQRNNTLVQLGGLFVSRGLGAEDAKAFVQEVNLRICDPPLDEDELRDTIFRSIDSWARDDGVPRRRAYDAKRLRDACDLLTEGHTAESIVGREDQVVLWKGSSTLMVGAEASGKTTLAQGLAIAISSGEPWLDFPTRRRRVLYIGVDRPTQNEDSLRKLLGDQSLEPGWLSTYFGDLQDLVADPAGPLAMAEECCAEVVILDSVYAAAPVDISLNSDEWGRALSHTASQLNEAGIAFLATGHPPRNTGERDRVTSILGSRFQSAGFDSIVNLTGRGIVRLRQDKSIGTPFDEFTVSIDRRTREVRRLDREQLPIDVVRTLDEITVPNYTAAMGWTRDKDRSRASRELDKLRKEGLIVLAAGGSDGGGRTRRWELV